MHIVRIVVSTKLYKMLWLHVDDMFALIVPNGKMIHSYFARHVRDVVIWWLHVICWHKLYSLQST
jgi:hypothetical protein